MSAETRDVERAAVLGGAVDIAYRGMASRNAVLLRTTLADLVTTWSCEYKGDNVDAKSIAAVAALDAVRAYTTDQGHKGWLLLR